MDGFGATQRRRDRQQHTTSQQTSAHDGDAVAPKAAPGGVGAAAARRQSASSRARRRASELATARGHASCTGSAGRHRRTARRRPDCSAAPASRSSASGPSEPGSRAAGSTAIASVPMPGHWNTDSITTAPPSSTGMRSETTVITGSSALRNAWPQRHQPFRQAFGPRGGDVVLAQHSSIDERV